MNDKDLKLAEVRNRDQENSRLIEVAKTNAGIAEAGIHNYQKRIEQLKKECNLRVASLQVQLDRAIENAKYNHDTIEALIKKREVLHTEFKTVMHFGEVRCEYCKLYFKNDEILKRHQISCTLKPEIKIAAEQKSDIEEKRDSLLTRKEALEKELKGLRIPPEVPPEVIIEEKREIASEMRRIAIEMNGETAQIEWLLKNHKEWIEQYSMVEGGKAIWQGRITNGFRTWCEAKGYELEQ